MYSEKPISIKEFMILNQDEKLAEKIEQGELLEEEEQDKIQKYIKVYFITGGYPSVINTYIETRKLDLVYCAVDDVINKIYASFDEISDKKLGLAVKEIYQKIAEEIVKEDKSFQLLAQKNIFEKRRYKKALEWLVNNQFVIKIETAESRELKAINYTEFQLFYRDIGILTNMCKVKFEELLPFAYPYQLKSGSLFLQFVLQQLYKDGQRKIYCPGKCLNMNCGYLVEQDKDILSIFFEAEEERNEITNAIGTAVIISEETLEIEEKYLKIPSYAVWNL